MEERGTECEDFDSFAYVDKTVLRGAVRLHVVVDDHLGELVMLCEPVTLLIGYSPNVCKVLQQGCSP